MITRQEMEGKWKNIAGKVRERYGQITDDELEEAHGSVEQLIGLIQQKTGQAREEIENFLDSAVAVAGDVAEKGAKVWQDVKEKAGEYAQQANEYAQETYEQVSGRAKESFEQAQSMVRRSPLEALAVAFGVGVVIGVLMGASRRGA